MIDEEEKTKEGKRILSSPYLTHVPPDLELSEHFSSLMLSFDRFTTGMELVSMSVLTLSAWWFQIQVTGSMKLFHVALCKWGLSLLRRFYNNYLEACWCALPKYRTQTLDEHRLKREKDLTGRDKQQLNYLQRQDRLIFIFQFIFDVFIYFALPEYYPGGEITQTLPKRVGRLILNHYVLSFGMYWGHRALHKNPWLWKNIHVVHHWAKHPLSRTTFQEHWCDKIWNAVVGHFFAQVLVPLDVHMFYLSRVLRLCESLEKHSGVSGPCNLVHSVQRWIPFADMPHHHDWHHEGHKGSNYSFTPVGGLWDCLFGTRRAGRTNQYAQTRNDVSEKESEKLFSLNTKCFDGPISCFIPLCGLSGAVVARLAGFW